MTTGAWSAGWGGVGGLAGRAGWAVGRGVAGRGVAWRGEAWRGRGAGGAHRTAVVYVDVVLKGVAQQVGVRSAGDVLDGGADEDSVRAKHRGWRQLPRQHVRLGRAGHRLRPSSPIPQQQSPDAGGEGAPSAPRLKLEGAVHRSERRRQRRSARGGVALAWREHRQPAAGAGALDLLDAAVGGRRHHVPGEQLHCRRANVLNLNRVAPCIALRRALPPRAAFGTRKDGDSSGAVRRTPG